MDTGKNFFMLPNSIRVLPTLLYFLLVNFATPALAQKIHSHNDYLQKVPFWEAYANGAASIEVDVILRNDSLFVAHEHESINSKRTLQSLYLDRIRQSINLGFDYRPFLLLVDIKTRAEPTLARLMEVCESYQDILYSPQNTEGIKLVISGNRPPAEQYNDYPDYMYFDHQEVTDLEDLNLDKVALISFPFRAYSIWNGKGRIVEEERQSLLQVIDQVHAIGKPIRFWATPDSKTSWKALYELGIDYINTDQPYEANKYLSSLHDRLIIGESTSEIYHPSFASDGLAQKVDKIILMIGDGTGLAQLNAGMVGNGNQLNILNLKNIGFIKTNASDDFTTDSAAGATAFATGKKTHNRGIGQNDSLPYDNITSTLATMNFANGLVTTDKITGATPAAFYAHQKERDNISNIGLDLSRSVVNLFISAGESDFSSDKNGAMDSLISNGFEITASMNDIKNSKADKVGYFASTHGLPSVIDGRKGFLSNATESAIAYLNRNDQPFFLMVEGAHIDGGGHQNNAKMVVEEVIDFDQAVAVALKFADTNPGTLVIITADHETGGVSLPQGNIADKQIELEFSTDDHTGIMVPIFAYGPHADAFRGVYENTAVYHKIMEIIQTYHTE